MAWIIEKQPGRRVPSRYVVLSDIGPNDSDKVFDYDADLGEGSGLKVRTIRIEFVTSATAGNRVPFCEVRRANGDTRLAFQGANIAASTTKNTQVTAGLGFAAGTGTLVNYESMGDGFTLLPGESIRIRDQAAIDADDDQMLVHISGEIV